MEGDGYGTKIKVGCPSTPAQADSTLGVRAALLLVVALIVCWAISDMNEEMGLLCT